MLRCCGCTGRYFYMHEATQTCQWERPTAAEPVLPQTPAGADDARARAESNHSDDSTSGAQPQALAVACFTERSAIELRQLLGQMGINQATTAQSGHAQLEQEYSRIAATARANPRWVRDSAIKKCMICAADFSLRRWRRHCHCCGWVTCASCCSFTVCGLQRHFNKDGQLVVTPQGSTGSDVSACVACKQAAVAPQ